jgi:acyl carrier protein
MSVRETIVGVFTDVAREQQHPIAPPADDSPLFGLGLDSLSMAIIVARLESRLGADPFGEIANTEIPNTFGEFVALYEHAAAV